MQTPYQVSYKMKKFDPYKWFELVLIQEGIPKPTREYLFAKTILDRKWRADFCWPEHKLIVEIDGGAFLKKGKGGHTTGTGFRKDLEKLNQAELMGYTVLRFLPEQLTGYALGLIKQFFNNNSFSQ